MVSSLRICLRCSSAEN